MRQLRWEYMLYAPYEPRAGKMLTDAEWLEGLQGLGREGWEVVLDFGDKAPQFSILLLKRPLTGN